MNRYNVRIHGQYGDRVLDNHDTHVNASKRSVAAQRAVREWERSTGKGRRPRTLVVRIIFVEKVTKE